jgi:antitoxin PrlF
MPTATVTTKGQITIPKEVRDAMGIETGDRIEFIAEEKGVYKVVAATKDVRHLKGLVPKPAKPVSVEEMNRAVARAPSRR